MLRKDFDVTVVAQLESGLAALEFCEREQPEILILDLMLPELCGTEVLRRLRENGGPTRALIFAGPCDAALVLRALKSKPAAFVSKSDSLETFREAVGAMLHGCSFFTPFASKFLFDASTPDEQRDLSHREREVLQLIAEGRSNKEIATRLSVSVKTVENHRGNLKCKLGLRTTADLTRYAIRHGLIKL